MATRTQHADLRQPPNSSSAPNRHRTMAFLKTLLVLCLAGLALVACSPVPEPGGWHGKHEHYIIHVPYHVHTVHHHHVQKVPIYIKSKGWEPHGWW